ncbi:atp-binding cassette transporter subfamily a abca [Anaeramoeba flamelloides]|uniref:Atp-binding cassette transporter subfamily a abca n=1 Tax=Anaeramoeba flamelloides TaxID=1746091 RepID=A0AAV7ZZL1_9EUKA|nr:atp-binding cassette transporter subfamily a abca [Anaeramoeba flamelloides]
MSSLTSSSSSTSSDESTTDSEKNLRLSDIGSKNDNSDSLSQKQLKPAFKRAKIKKLKSSDQFHALFRKNLRLQKRSKKSNCCVGFVALFVVFLIYMMQLLTNRYLNSDREEETDPKKYEFDLLDTMNLPFSSEDNDSILDTFQQRLSQILTTSSYLREDYDLHATFLTDEEDMDSLEDLLYETYNENDDKLVSGFYMNSMGLDVSSKKELDYKVYYNGSGSNSAMGFQRTTHSDLGQTIYIPAIVNLINRAAFAKVWEDSDLNGTVDTTYGYNLKGPDIRVGLKDFPTTDGENKFDLVLVVQPFYYTFLVHFLLPVFMIIIVYEKENKLVDIMIMFGLKMKVYWSVNYFFNFTIYMFLILVFYIAGYALEFRFFIQNNFLAHSILFILWGFSMVSFGFFLSTLFRKVRMASLIGYFLVIILTLVSNLVWDNIIDSKGTGTKALCMFLPSFAIYSGIKVLSDHSSLTVEGFKFSNFNTSSEGLGMQYLMLFADTILYLLFTGYLYSVLPSTGGKKSPLFFLNPKTYKKFFRDLKKKKKNYQDDDSDEEQSQEMYSDDDFELNEDPRGENIPEDVERERQRVINNNDPIRMINLYKVYKGQDGNPDVNAVNCLTLGIKLNECFGILGPNGAGKTTSVNILSGLFPATSGTAKICGFDIKKEMSQVHSIMSVCPQHDILWDDQTGEETLKFYARMHGYKNKELVKKVSKTLNEVGLYNDRKKLIKEYSGGMKRRISVACALITNPKVIFLDEPTTGLDPASKRQVWDVIRKARQEKSIILTTHSMEEADSLCDRIGIMANGILRTIGESQELKSRYGKGFKLMVHCNAEDDEKVKNFIKKTFPNANEMNSLAGTSNFEVPSDEVVLSEVFQILEEQKNDLGILDWGISQTTLEEVFHEITRIAEGQAQLEI